MPFKQLCKSLWVLLWWQLTLFSKAMVSFKGTSLATDAFLGVPITIAGPLEPSYLASFCLLFWSYGTVSIHLSVFSRGFCPANWYYTIWPICAFKNVFLMIISSSWRSFWKPLPPLNERSLKLKERGPSPLLQSRCSNCYSCWIKVPLISKSGRLELRNSSVLSIDHLYLRIK